MLAKATKNKKKVKNNIVHLFVSREQLVFDN